jgi:hypothetical protein
VCSLIVVIRAHARCGNSAAQEGAGREQDESSNLKAIARFGETAVLQFGRHQSSEPAVQMALGVSAETDESAAERPAAEAAWEVNSALVNEGFEAWVADPAVVDRTERHTLPSAVRSAHAFAPPASSSSGVRNALQLLPSCDAALFFGEDLRVYALGVQPLVGDSRLCKHGTVQVVLEPPPYSVGVATTAPSIALVEEPQVPDCLRATHCSDASRPMSVAALQTLTLPRTASAGYLTAWFVCAHQRP